MPTSRISLDPTQYVRVNVGLNPIILEANEGEVKVVVTQNQPSVNNGAFHRLNDRQRLHFPSVDANVWVLALNSNQKAVVTEMPPALVNQGLEPFTNNSLQSDAWGRTKAVIDQTLVHGVFTYEVPVTKWYEMIDDVEQLSFVSATTEDGKLVLASGALNEKRQLRTFENPRYEPNRGQLYAASIILPSPSAEGERTFGTFTAESGAGFRLRSGTLYAFRRTTVGGSTTDTETAITLPSGVDLSKGNIYDIQFQWRGVGNYYFFVNLQLVASFEILGTLTELSLFNPANPIAFESINQGDAVQIECGCVDVTSEGGSANGKTYGSLVATDITINGTSQPVLIVRSKRTHHGLINTRDTQGLAAVFSADTRCTGEVWATRDDTAITLNTDTWTDFGDGSLEYIIVNTATFDTTKATQSYGAKIPANETLETKALYEGITRIIQTPGDIFVFAFSRNTNVSASVTYEFAEAI